MRARWLRLAVIVSLVALVLPMRPVQASINTCTAQYSPTSVAPDRESYFSFDVYNGTSVNLNWIQIMVPADSGVTITAGSATGWTTDITAEIITFSTSSNTLPPNANKVFSVKAQTGSEVGAMGDWAVNVSDSNDMGATCTGDLALTVESQPSDVAISNVNVINLGQTAATITWDTNVPANGQVVYGKTASYGSTTPLSSTLTLTHSLTIQGLSANTGYHFAAKSGTTDSDVVTSSDGTFLTLPVPPPVTAGSNGAPRGTIATLDVPAETEPPTISLVSSLAKPFTKDLTLTGVARDNAAVARVDYSLDGGKSWVLVPSPPGLGTKQASFSFAPPSLEDGNYPLTVRATDTSGNTAASPVAVWVVDRQPPQIGTELVLFDNQVAQVDSGGRWQAAVGADQTVTMNAVGGPISLTLVAALDGTRSAAQSFYLRQNQETGLWSGLLSFRRAGLYHLTAVAIDGAGTQTVRVLSDVLVGAAARVVSQVGSTTLTGGVVRGARVTLYAREASSGRWLPWQAEPYGQANPQTISADGSFRLLAPAGTYYLRVQAPGYATLITQQFQLDRPTPIVPTMRLAKQPRLTIGSWSWVIPAITLSQTKVDPAGGLKVAAATASAMVGHPLPAFRLPRTTGGMVTAVDLKGRPTVVTLLSTWSPTTAEQLPALAAVAKHADVRVVPLFLGERLGKVQTALARGGYDLSALVDEAVVWGDKLGAPNVPTHYFLERGGTVTAVYSGTLTADQMLSRLSGR